MPRRRPIRDKLLLGGLLVGIMVVTLSASSFLGIYSYRRLVRALSCRAAELPRASELGECASLLRLAHARARAGGMADFPGVAILPSAVPAVPPIPGSLEDGFEPVDEQRPDFGDSFAGLLARASWALDQYRAELAAGELDDMPFGDRSRERETAREVETCLGMIAAIVERHPGSAAAAGEDASRGVEPDVDPAADVAQLRAIEPHLERLSTLTAELPSFLQERLHDLSREVRTGYRTLIITTWASAMAAVMLLGALGVLTYRWVFRPLRLLGRGSRRVAAGDFAYRLKLDTRDEMAELAAALNDMTMRFQEIRDDLDRQVQLRTREVIRSEQLASVGFLAAGVAHEINNPLASIAMCAESLESRLEALATDEADARVTKRYLELIQNEAFRCKGITEKLLDFSRLGEVRRLPTAVLSLAKDVADMLRHVGRFAGKAIEIEEGADILVMVNPQEIKQVVLNLLVNALDSVEETGSVRVAVRRAGSEALLTVTDDGCGMTEEVLEHLFEPFFTRRKAGQGTGLGLSIVHRIVTDHGGRIEASSDGPGRGATFRVSLPIADVGAGAASQIQSPSPRATEREVDHQDQAA